MDNGILENEFLVSPGFKLLSLGESLIGYVMVETEIVWERS